MTYNLGEVEISAKDVSDYKESAIGKIYAILCVFEDGIDPEKDGTYDSYLTYLKRVINEFSGVYKLFGPAVFISLVAHLRELCDVENPTKEEVKSVVFHCISEVKRARVMF